MWRYRLHRRYRQHLSKTADTHRNCKVELPLDMVSIFSNLYRSPPDARDVMYTLGNKVVAASVDLTDKLPPALDQGTVGPCAVSAACVALQYLVKLAGGGDFLISRIALYYVTRVYVGDGSTQCCLRNVCKAMSKYLIHPEQYWSYTVSRFAEEPPGFTSTLIAKPPIVKYRAVPRDTASICCALSTGTPIIAGIEVYEGFCSQETARTGVVALPMSSEKKLGTHACLICGYSADSWICRNSFGPHWGRKGNFTLPRVYLTSHLCFDLWILSDLNFERQTKVEV